MNTMACNEVRSLQSAMSSSCRQALKYLNLRDVSKGNFGKKFDVADLPFVNGRFVAGVVEVFVALGKHSTQCQDCIEER